MSICHGPWCSLRAQGHWCRQTLLIFSEFGAHENRRLLHDTLTWEPTTAVAEVPEDLMLFSGLRRHQAHMWYAYIHAGETLIVIK